MPDAEERMLLDDKNEDPTERNSRCTEEVTNAELFSLLEIYMNDKLKGPNRTTKPAKILYTCTCITTLKIHKYIYIVNY
jgi:hypothetical protein